MGAGPRRRRGATAGLARRRAAHKYRGASARVQYSAAMSLSPPMSAEAVLTWPDEDFCVASRGGQRIGSLRREGFGPYRAFDAAGSLIGEYVSLHDASASVCSIDAPSVLAVLQPAVNAATKAAMRTRPALAPHDVSDALLPVA